MAVPTQDVTNPVSLPSFYRIILLLFIRRSLVRSRLVSLKFFIDIKSFWSHYEPAFDSASNKNEYQEHFLGVKAAGAWGWQPYHHSVPLSWNPGTLTSWNPLDHSRLVTALICLFYYCYLFWQRLKSVRLFNDKVQRSPTFLCRCP